MPAVDFRREGQIMHVVISNPAKHNALTIAMWRQLRDGIRGLAGVPGLRCLVLTGAGDRAFAAGADIGEFAQARSTPEQVTCYHEEIVGPALQALIDSDLVSIASINGDCTGGGLEIASACDLRVAADTARFGAAVARLGFPLALGETEIFVRKFGFPVAAEILLEGRLLAAAEALQKGLVGRVVPAEGLAATTGQMAASVTAMSPMALRAMKRQVRRLLGDASPVTAAERAEYYGFAATADYAEGLAAFLGKRSPRFGDA